MKIVVLGAGTVGHSTAELLCQHGHSVSLVDDDLQKVRRAKETLDLRAIHGDAAHSSTLFQAGVLDCDLCLAITGDDHTNLLAASIAKEMGARRTVARVFAPVFRDVSTFDYQRQFKIDRLLSLEHLTAMELAKGIRHGGAIAVENFADGELEVREFIVDESTRSVGVALKDLGLPKGVRIGSIYRDGKMSIAMADDLLRPEDRITLIGARDEIDEYRDWFQKELPPKLGIAIAGGGETGFHLARMLEGLRFAVVLLENDPQRCEFLSTHLKRTTVIHGDATMRSVLEEERIGSADIFVACIGDDEDNLISGVEAADVGAETIMAVVNRPDYGHIIKKLGIQHTVSPRDVMAKQVLSFLNQGPVISQSKLANGTIGILEIEVLEDVPATEHVLANLDLPRECLIAAVLRQDYAKVPGGDDRLVAGDTVVALVEAAATDDLLELFNGGHRANGT